MRLKGRLSVLLLLLAAEAVTGGRFGGGGRGGGGGGRGGGWGRSSSSSGSSGWSRSSSSSSGSSGAKSASYPKQQWGSSSGSSAGGSSGGGSASYPKQQWGSSSGGSGSARAPSGGSSIGGGGFVNPGAGSYGTSSRGGSSYRSPGYGTNYGTSFAGGTGRYGDDRSGYSRKALGLGVGAGFLGGAALGVAGTVATMGVYHRYNEYQRLMYLRQHGYYNDDYYNSYYRRGQCYGGCPAFAHCIFGLCQCNPGFEQQAGGCYRAGQSPPARPAVFDPYQSCSDSRVCQAMDINLVCMSNSSSLFSTAGRCACRKDMRWNSESGECQLFLDVDCSRITYDTKPSQVVLEAANATLAKLAENENITLEAAGNETLEAAGNETLEAAANETLEAVGSNGTESVDIYVNGTSNSTQNPDLAINKALANSLLSSIDPKKATEEEIREAFCRDVDSFSWELVKREPPPNHSVPTAIGVVVALVLIAVCCCGCFLCCCKSKAKSCLGRNKGKSQHGEEMSFSAVKPADNGALNSGPMYQQAPAYPPATDSNYQAGYAGSPPPPYPQSGGPAFPTYPPAGGDAAYPPAGAPYPPAGAPYPPAGGTYPPAPYPNGQSGYPVYPPVHTS